MNILLDTHVLIWALENNPRLSGRACSAIVEGRNMVYISAVSVWEISIKRALGKLRTPDNLLEEISLHRFSLLDISGRHAEAAGALPMIHRDPFDRMLVAQCRLEKLTLITADQNIGAYDVSIISALK
jgi:PIN domain nuclease of toxin-antitoxin system